jgi:SAM-dependent methyltransferase
MPHTPDTGAALRSLYQAEGGVKSVFSAKVADYVASRPDYPAALFDTLADWAGLSAGSTIADVGAGTGLLTQGWLQRGCRAIAVEPNAAMRHASDERLQAESAYRSIEGSAESMPLPDGSVHLITAAQAFHWFDIKRAQREFLRVLDARGAVALIWNDRVAGDPLHLALDEVFATFGGAKLGALVAHENRADVPRFFGSARPREFACAHSHALSADGLLSLVFSRSYMPGRNTNAGLEITSRVARIFRRFAQHETVHVPYRTVAIVGRPVA